MFLLRPPSRPTVERFLALQRDLPFTYAEVGATRPDRRPPEGYDCDHNRVRLGAGSDVFERACDALRRWEMFNLGWVKVLWPSTPVEVGGVVGVLASAGGLLSLNACRITYLVERAESSADGVERFGFAYGTLPGHVERGEERFSVEWHRRDRGGDDSVWYDILAFSKPQHPLARLGYPFVRLMQKRFARDSKRAMLRAAGGSDVPLDPVAPEI